MGPQGTGTRPLADWMVRADTARTSDAAPDPAAWSPAERAIPTYTPQIYGEVQMYPCIYNAAGDELALARPVKGVRNYLLIVNRLAANEVMVMFDAEATAVAGVPIPPGGHYLLDAFVPQGDLHIFSPVAGIVLCFYSQQDITDTRKILAQVGA